MSVQPVTVPVLSFGVYLDTSPVGAISSVVPSAKVYRSYGPGMSGPFGSFGFLTVGVLAEPTWPPCCWVSCLSSASRWVVSGGAGGGAGSQGAGMFVPGHGIRTVLYFGLRICKHDASIIRVPRHVHGRDRGTTKENSPCTFHRISGPS